MMRYRALFALAPAALLCAAARSAAPLPPLAAAPGAPGGFAQALAPRAFEFPRDHGPHAEFRQEWWYVTGNLDGPSGERFGFELTFFRFALAPPAAPAPSSAGAEPRSAWRTREIYMAHFAVTDPAAGRFRFAQKLSRAALGLAGAQGAPLKVWIDDWSLTGGEPWRLRAAQPGYELELELTALTPPVLNGDAGLSVKAQDPGAASYYYSIPRLAVRGRLRRGGAVIPVHGLAWFDREWGSGALGANEAGWDWFALQLSDGSALMFYQLRDRDGARDPHSAGTFIAAGGVTQPLAERKVSIEVLDHWSDAQGVRYPSAWRVRVPDLSLDLTVRPVLSDQELKTQPRYWEGAVDVTGTGATGPTRGRGYVELVGYARNGE